MNGKEALQRLLDQATRYLNLNDEKEAKVYNNMISYASIISVELDTSRNLKKALKEFNEMVGIDL